MIGEFLDEPPEVDHRRVAPLELEVGPAHRVEGVGEERRGGLGRDDAGIGRARVGEALHPVERLGLPEARFLGLAGNGREPLRLPEGLERGLERPLGEPGLAQEEHRLAGPLVAGEALEEALEHAAGERVEPVLVGLLADQHEPVGLVEGQRGPGGGDGHESREEQAGERAEVRHTDTVRLPRPPGTASTDGYSVAAMRAARYNRFRRSHHGHERAPATRSRRAAPEPRRPSRDPGARRSPRGRHRPRAPAAAAGRPRDDLPLAPAGPGRRRPVRARRRHAARAGALPGRRRGLDDPRPDAVRARGRRRGRALERARGKDPGPHGRGEVGRDPGDPRVSRGLGGAPHVPGRRGDPRDARRSRRPSSTSGRPSPRSARSACTRWTITSTSSGGCRSGASFSPIRAASSSASSRRRRS